MGQFQHTGPAEAIFKWCGLIHGGDIDTQGVTLERRKNFKDLYHSIFIWKNATTVQKLIPTLSFGLSLFHPFQNKNIITF